MKPFIKSNRIKAIDVLLSIRDEIRNLNILKKSVLTIDEASYMTGLEVNTLYKYTAEGIIPCSKPNGKKLYFQRAELEAWMLQNRRSDIDLSDEVDDQLFKNSRHGK